MNVYHLSHSWSSFLITAAWDFTVVKINFFVIVRPMSDTHTFLYLFYTLKSSFSSVLLLIEISTASFTEKEREWEPSTYIVKWQVLPAVIYLLFFWLAVWSVCDRGSTGGVWVRRTRLVSPHLRTGRQSRWDQWDIWQDLLLQGEIARLSSAGWYLSN